MNMRNGIRFIAFSALGFTMLMRPVAAEQQTKIDLSSETVGAEPKSLVPVVGIWRIESEGGKNVLAVDGRQWKEGQSSAGVTRRTVVSIMASAASRWVAPDSNPKTSPGR
jgi:hypothetical protein